MNTPQNALLLLLMIVTAACSTPDQPAETLFVQLPAAQTGIDFANALSPTPDLNILDYNYYYNGGGVAAADFNGDGLTDLYFTGNQVSSRLYLNKGGLRFEEVTQQAGVGTAHWAAGVAVADVNNDSLPDLYVSFAGLPDPAKRANQLFINQGNDQNNIPLFKEQAQEYGLADTSYTTQSLFFDYDRDGDLDVVMANHFQDLRNPNYPRPIVSDGQSASNVRLYRNDGSQFTQVAQQAGLLAEGYSLGVAVSDFNQDGWPDLYFSKDFIYDDALYINNQNGTFTESIRQYMAHTSQFSMGCDVGDYNNDGYPDLFVVDMLPDDNKRQKLMNIAMNNDRFQLALDLGYMPQYSRNMLQLNNGPDAQGKFSFSEVGRLAGIHQTDWSWSPLLADLDNDGWKDLFVTNGIPQDITNNDFVLYRSQQIEQAKADYQSLKGKMLEQIALLEPVNKPNFAFRNQGDLTFADRGKEWGLALPGLSNGAIYADLDNDGDLDLVTNNLNGPAWLFENQSNKQLGHHYLRVQLRGHHGIGAQLRMYANGQSQWLEYNPVRGFQSSQEPFLHVGLGKAAQVDNLVLTWPDGRQQRLTALPADQVLTLHHRDAQVPQAFPQKTSPIFTEITTQSGLEVVHTQLPFEDFNLEPLLPHRFSRNGPYLATGDVDGNGLEDIWMGGAAKLPGKILLQQAGGQFLTMDMPDPGFEDMGGALFDADGDGDLDLYVVSGGNAYNPLTAAYQDRLYLNNGNGKFERDKTALPDEVQSGSCVVPNDFDQDGDLDLFVGGRVVPTRYPFPPASFILQNDGKGKFLDVTGDVCPELRDIGMVTDARWADLDGDGREDLALVGEWMPLTLFRNHNGTLQRFGPINEWLQSTTGWWFSLATADFDDDGDTDLVAGNLGLNNYYRVSPQTPLSVYAKDFLGNGSVKPILSYYLNGQEWPIAQRDQLVSVAAAVKRTFPTYGQFAEAKVRDLFPEAEWEGALRLKASELASVYVENKGGGNFAIRPLPIQAQFAPIQAMLVEDFDSDGHLDILAAGNFHSPDFMTGRYDASKGVLLKGDGQGRFTPLPMRQSGIRIEGDTRRLSAYLLNGRPAVLSLPNQGQMQVWQWEKQSIPGNNQVSE